MRDQYRIAVAGPGGLGACVIRELTRLKETRVAGVLAYSPQKHGVDAGTLAGIPAIGMPATTDFSEFLKIDCECVIYTARDQGDFKADAEILALLEAGKNVITPLPYHFLAARGDEVRRRFEAAAIKGGATLHGSGITPGFFNERLAMLMTGLSNDVRQITMQEFFNAELLADSLPTLQIIGLGASREHVESNPAVAMMAENYLKQPILYAAEKLGVTIDRIERTGQVKTTVDAIETPFLTIEPGKVGLVSYAWTGFCGDTPFYRTEVYWYFGTAMRPEAARSDDFWTVTIEGRPSLRISVEGRDSFATPPPDPVERAPAGYVMTVIALVQAIPAVIAAPACLLLPSMPEIHWKRDMREGP